MNEWNVDWARDTAKNGGRFGSVRVREAVYKNNCEIFSRWAYPVGGGMERNLEDRIAFLNGTKVYAREFDVSDIPSNGYKTRLGCVNADCAEVASELVRSGHKPAILNLASRHCACGGYHNGCRAQEEAICRVSTLSQSLYQYFDEKRIFVRKAQVPHRFNAYPLDINFGGIFSPDVTFFRYGSDRYYAFRDEPFKCGVVTVSALSFREANTYNVSELEYRSDDGGFTSEGEKIMLNKIRTIYRLALKGGCDSIVLGAFGCGAYRLRPDLVAELFERVLNEDEFRGKFKALPFAILEGKGTSRKPVEENGKFAAFYRRFGRW